MERGLGRQRRAILEVATTTSTHALVLGSQRR